MMIWWKKLKHYIAIKCGVLRTHEHVDWQSGLYELNKSTIPSFLDSLPLLTRIIFNEIWINTNGTNDYIQRKIMQFRLSFLHEIAENEISLRHLNESHCVIMERVFHFWKHIATQDDTLWQNLESELQQAFKPLFENQQILHVNGCDYPFMGFMSIKPTISIDFDFQSDKLYIHVDDSPICTISYVFEIQQIKIEVKLTYNLFTHEVSSQVICQEHVVEAVWRQIPLEAFMNHNIRYRVSKEFSQQLLPYIPLFETMSCVNEEMEVFHGDYCFQSEQELQDWLTILMERFASMFGANVLILPDKPYLEYFVYQYLDSLKGTTFFKLKLASPSYHSHEDEILKYNATYNGFSNHRFRHCGVNKFYAQHSNCKLQLCFENIGLYEDVLIHSLASLSFAGSYEKEMPILLFYYHFGAHTIGVTLLT